MALLSACSALRSEGKFVENDQLTPPGGYLTRKVAADEYGEVL